MTAPAPTLSIADLVAIPKTVARAFRTSTRDAEHVRLDLELAASCPGTFHVFVRVLRALSESFSIGLRYEAQPGDTVLLRVNGDHGRHRNPDGGFLIEGPHVHSFVPPSRDAPPRPAAEARWAWPLPTENLALPRAWSTFQRAVALTSTAEVDRKIARLYTELSQLPLGIP